MKQQQNSYKTLTDLSKQLLRSRQLPIYSSRFSRKDFTTYQLMTLLVAKTYENKGYRTFVEWLEASHLPKWLGLNKIPHYTTLQKFASRQLIKQLEKLLLASGTMAKKACEHAGLDATGMTLHHASRHYEKRVGTHVLKRGFLKCTIAADLDNQLVWAVKMRKRPRGDIKDFTPLWNKIRHLDFRWWYADKGYDAESAFRAVQDADKISFGCIRDKTRQRYRMKGKARRRASGYSRYRQKNWRALIETMNSVIKGRFGSVVQARSLHNIKVEMLLKLITYNLYRLGTRNLAKIASLLARFFGRFWSMLCHAPLGWPLPGALPE